MARLATDASGVSLRGDQGVSLILTALLIIPLMAATAFAVDVGTWYTQGAKMQRAVDSASLAGVIWLPDKAKARQASTEALARNWPFPTTPPVCTVTNCDINSTGEWTVKAATAAPTYFARAVGFNSQTLGRTATAAINPSIPLGSPWPSFGNNLTNGCTDPDNCTTDPNGNPQPNLWATIQYPYTSHQDGDPFTTRCWGDSLSSTDCTSPPTFDNDKNGVANAVNPTNPVYSGANAKWNPDYKPDGYLYAINVLTPGSITVQIYDASCDAGVPRGDTTSTDSNTGGDSCNSVTPTDFQMYNYSGNTYTINANAGNELSGCRKTAPAAGVGGDGASTYKNKWVTLCTFTAASAGIYPLRVRNDNIPAPSPAISGFTGCAFTNIQTASGCKGSGYNSFAIRSTGASAQLFAIDYMSIWNGNGGAAEFFLANIESVNKGKKVQLDMYDPGDGSAGSPYVLSIKGPDALGNPNLSLPCTWNRSDIQGGTSNLSGSSTAPCTVTSRDTSAAPYSRFNDQWIRVEFTLPNNYTCPVNQNKCWWKIKYNLPASATPTDRTVWALKILGDPVHLTS